MTKGKSEELFVAGIDLHADQFTAALLSGRTALDARREWVHHAVDNASWKQWLTQKIPKGTILVFEAGTNSFEFAARAERLGLKAVVLESTRVGKLAKDYCKTDKEDAVKLARIYFSGLAEEVWQPDELTRQRRELCSAYDRAVKDSTRTTNRLKSFLTQHGVRLRKRRLRTPDTQPWVLTSYPWTKLQAALLTSMFRDEAYTHERRHSLRAKVIELALESPDARELMKLCGIRAITAFELVAVIGDIKRFKTPKKLVTYIGLNPTVSQSADKDGSRRVRKRGKKCARSKLIQSAKSFLRAKHTPSTSLQKWGLKLKMRKGANKATVAVARKMVVAAWYLLNGLMPREIADEKQMRAKLKKIAETLTAPILKTLGYDSSRAFIEDYLQCFSLVT